MPETHIVSLVPSVRTFKAITAMSQERDTVFLGVGVALDAAGKAEAYVMALSHLSHDRTAHQVVSGSLGGFFPNGISVNTAPSPSSSPRQTRRGQIKPWARSSTLLLRSP